jgi:hypothetical protein
MLLWSFVKKFSEIPGGDAIFRLLREDIVEELSVGVGILGQDNEKGLLIDDISIWILIDINLDNNLLGVARSCAEGVVPDCVNISNVGCDCLSVEESFVDNNLHFSLWSERYRADLVDFSKRSEKMQAECSNSQGHESWRGGMSQHCKLLPRVDCSKTWEETEEASRVEQVSLVERAFQLLKLYNLRALSLSQLVLNMQQVGFVWMCKVFSFQVKWVQFVFFSWSVLHLIHLVELALEEHKLLGLRLGVVEDVFFEALQSVGYF